MDRSPTPALILAVVTCRFSAVHRWPEAPAEGPAWHLSNAHRHEFHVRAELVQRHADRDVEYLTVKERLENFCAAQYHHKDLGRRSCEDLAAEVAGHLTLLGHTVSEVQVLEDGENGTRLVLPVEHGASA